MSRVSVIIPCCNGARFIRAAIASALAQGVPDLEVVVADDGSSDDSRDLVAAFGPPVRLIEVHNGNTQATRNAAIAASDGELIALLDQDDTWRPGKLERQMGLLAAHPDIGLCYTDTQGVDLEGRPLPERHNPLAQPRDQREALGLLLGVNIMAASTVLMRRSVLERVGTFDPRFHLAGDWDLWLRIAEEYRVAAVPEVLIDYCWHGENESRRLEAMDQESIAVQESALARIARHPRWSTDPGLERHVLRARRRLAFRWSALGMRQARSGREVEALQSHRQALALQPMTPNLVWRMVRTMLGITGSGDEARKP